MRIVIVLVALVGMLAVQVSAAPTLGTLPAATVNGEEISYDEYQAALETLVVPSKSANQRVAGAQALSQLILGRLLIQLAEKEAVPVSDAMVDQRIQALKKQGTNIQAALQSRYQTPIEFRRELKVRLAFANLALKCWNVSDAEIEDFYFKNKSKYNLPTRVRVAAIVTPDKKKIDQAQQKLKQGVDFGATVAQFSDDPMTKRDGGTLGWVWPNQQGVPGSVANTAMGLEVGSVSRPIQVQGQWVILKALERRPPSPKPLEEVKEEIREGLAVERASRKPELKAKIAQFRKNSDIQVFVKRFSKDLASEIKSDDVSGKQ